MFYEFELTYTEAVSECSALAFPAQESPPIQEVGRYTDDDLMDAFDAKEEDEIEDEILVPLYKSMAEEDVRFFEECRELKALSDNTELIAAAFKVEWEGAEIGELSRRMTGDVKRAKIVEQTKMRYLAM